MSTHTGRSAHDSGAELTPNLLNLAGAVFAGVAMVFYQLLSVQTGAMLIQYSSGFFFLMFSVSVAFPFKVRSRRSSPRMIFSSLCACSGFGMVLSGVVTIL